MTKILQHFHEKGVEYLLREIKILSKQGATPPTILI